MFQNPEEAAEKLLKSVPAAMYFLLAAGTLTLAWAILSLWPSQGSGLHSVAVAGAYYRTGTLIGLMLFSLVAWQRRRMAPDPFGMRRLFGWVAVAALVWAAMHAAALLALPTTA